MMQHNDGSETLVFRTVSIDYTCAETSLDLDSALVDAAIDVLKANGAKFEGASAGPTKDVLDASPKTASERN